MSLIPSSTAVPLQGGRRTIYHLSTEAAATTTESAPLLATSFALTQFDFDPALHVPLLRARNRREVADQLDLVFVPNLSLAVRAVPGDTRIHHRFEGRQAKDANNGDAGG